MSQRRKAILINLFFCILINAGFGVILLYYIGDNTEDWFGLLLALFITVCQFFASMLSLSIYDIKAKEPDALVKVVIYAFWNLLLPFLFIGITFVVQLYFSAFIIAFFYISCSVGYWWASKRVEEEKR